jgi:hypothetical protein
MARARSGRQFGLILGGWPAAGKASRELVSEVFAVEMVGAWRPALRACLLSHHSAARAKAARVQMTIAFSTASPGVQRGFWVRRSRSGLLREEGVSFRVPVDLCEIDARTQSRVSLNMRAKLPWQIFSTWAAGRPASSSSSAMRG